MYFQGFKEEEAKKRHAIVHEAFFETQLLYVYIIYIIQFLFYSIINYFYSLHSIAVAAVSEYILQNNFKNNDTQIVFFQFQTLIVDRFLP